MEKLFQKKYRIASARLRSWDYSADGYYLVTICTKDKKQFFGEIKNKEMFLSPIGEIVQEEWKKTPAIRNNVKLDHFVVMPNHIHGIMIIDNWSVETHCNASLQDSINNKNKFGPQSNNLPSIIRGFKGSVTRMAHHAGFTDFAWQPRYYDHIIVDDEDHNNIQDYILTNVANWGKDKENLEANFANE